MSDMGENITRTIRKEKGDIEVSFYVRSDDEYVSHHYGEVRLLENGWLECRKGLEEEYALFLPPGVVGEVGVYDEDKPTGTF